MNHQYSSYSHFFPESPLNSPSNHSFPSIHSYLSQQDGLENPFLDHNPMANACLAIESSQNIHIYEAINPGDNYQRPLDLQKKQEIIIMPMKKQKSINSLAQNLKEHILRLLDKKKNIIKTTRFPSFLKHNKMLCNQLIIVSLFIYLKVKCQINHNQILEIFNQIKIYLEKRKNKSQDQKLVRKIDIHLLLTQEGTVEFDSNLLNLQWLEQTCQDLFTRRKEQLNKQMNSIKEMIEKKNFAMKPTEIKDQEQGLSINSLDIQTLIKSK